MKQNSESPGREDNDSKHWIGGIFYYNPSDKRIFPPKRFSGAGWTVNFANLYSILALLLLIIAIVAINVFLFSR